MSVINSDPHTEQEQETENNLDRGAIYELEQKKTKVITELSDYIRYTFNTLGAHSQAEASSTQQEIDRLKNINLMELTGEELTKQRREIEDNLKWLNMEGGIKSQRQKIVDAWIDLNIMLNTAVASKAISSKSKQDWLNRFKDSNIGAGTKLEFVRFELPVLLFQAEREAGERKEILKSPELKKITPKMVEKIGIYKDEKKFLSSHYLVRKNLNAEVTAAIATIKTDMPKLHSEAKAILQAAVASGAMSPNKVGKWLKSLFAQDRSPEEIKAIMKGELREYIGIWTKLRYRYNWLEKAIDIDGLPPGINRLSPEKFLDLDYFERENYVTEAEYAMALLKKGFSDKPIDKMKLEIRSFIAQKDWDGAQAVIAKARGIAEGEDVYELNSMDNNIRLSILSSTEKGETEEEKPDQSADKILAEMRQVLLEEVPASERNLYIKALNAGPEEFASLCTLLYNRIWCWDNGYLDEEIEADLSHASTDETQKILSEGHRKHGLENIDLDIVNENEQEKAMRPYQNTWAPTVMHLDASNGSSCGTLVNELREKVEARDYWSSLILKNISYAKQRELVMTVNRRLKGNARKLHAMGHGFSMNGKVNLASPAKNTSDAGNTSFAMAS